MANLPQLAEFVAGFEGYREQSYQDPAGIWTIGFGATRWLTGRPVGPGEVITRGEALQLLEANLQSASDAVTRLVKVPLTEGQRISLCSFAFNCGVNALAKSTLLRKLNTGDYAGAADELPKWNRAGGRILPGLVRRRAEERRLFLGTPSPATAPSARAAPASVAPAPHTNPSEPPMLPFVAAAIPALIEAAPQLIRLFGKGEQSERNAQAAEKVVQVAQAITGTDTAEGAVKAIQADPAKASEFREAVHQNWGDLMSLVERVAELDAKSVQAARDFAGTPTMESPVFIITLIVLGMVAAGLGFVLVKTTEKDMLVMIVQALVGFGMAAVGFWLGSSHGSLVKTMQK